MYKRYPVDQCPLFRLRGERKFELVLGISVTRAKLLVSTKNYRVFTNELGREIQHPIGVLEALHRRIATLLRRIELPDYVYSQLGRSYVDNAKQHVGNVPLVKTDVCKFYPSTTHGMVFRMFAEYLECAGDLAKVLADVVCYSQKHLPTGSPLSGYVAYLASKSMFDEIHSFAVSRRCKMTLFVDDIAISGIGANAQLLGDVRAIVRAYGHRTVDRKSTTFAPAAPKTVTGVVATATGVMLPNRRHEKICRLRRQLTNAPPTELESLRRELAGRLQEARQID